MYKTALIAAAASIVAVCLTYYYSKRMIFFQTYFDKKLEAYTEYWEAYYNYMAVQSDEAQAQFAAKTGKIAVLAPEVPDSKEDKKGRDIYKRALVLQVYTVQEIQLGHVPKSGTDIDILIGAMRRDLDRCRRMKFGPSFWDG